MLQLANRSAYAVRFLVLPDRRGADAAVLIIQGSFRLGDGKRLDIQAPLVDADAWAGEPGASALVEASDIALEKPSTDVLLEGIARPEGGRAQPTFTTAFAVGPVRKTVRVVGPRAWRKTWFGERAGAPQPVDAVPLTWDQTEVGDRPPALEHPERPVARRGRAPEAWGGCGPIPGTWQPRRVHAGTYDERWQRTRAPWLPEDFDPRFFQVAPPDQIAPTHLQGGEPVELWGCHPAGNFRGALPTRRPVCAFDVDGAVQRPMLRLDTVRLRPEADEVRLVWRTTLPLGRKVLRLRTIEVADG